MAMTATQHANTLFISGTHSIRAIDKHMAPRNTGSTPVDSKTHQPHLRGFTSMTVITKEH